MTNHQNELIIGVDVSKNKLDIWVKPFEKAFQINNEEKSIKAFFKKLQKQSPIGRVVCEATGGYEKRLRKVAHELGVEVHCGHPTQIHYFGKAKGHFAKTDRRDAQLIAEYGHQADLRLTPYDAKEEVLQDVLTTKDELKKDIVRMQNRLQRTGLCSESQRVLKKVQACLKKQLKELETQLDQLLESDTERQAKIARLKTFKGVGTQIAQTLVIDVPELGVLSREQIACLIGLAPRNRDSGQKQGRRFMSGGRVLARKQAYMMALVSVRHNEQYKILYQQFLAKGKAPKVALIAVARKIVIVLNAMLKKGTDWQSNYTQAA